MNRFSTCTLKGHSRTRIMYVILSTDEISCKIYQKYFDHILYIKDLSSHKSFVQLIVFLTV